jgi:DNA (cytosine-5)-methyltransferase 1
MSQVRGDVTYTLGSLFSGVGALDVGIERAFDGNLETIWQVELNDYCRQVLAKHWPNAIRHRDVCKVGARNLSRVDVIAGGYPCTDLASGSKRAGLSGPHSALWFEYARIIGELRPRVAVIENSSLSLTPVPGSTEPAIQRVLSDLVALGYNAWWTCLRAADVGAPHRRRDRLFVVAYTNGDGLVELGTHDVQAHEGMEIKSGHDVTRRGEAGGRRTADGPGGAGAGWMGVAIGELDRNPRWSTSWLDGYPACPGERQHPWEPARRVSSTDRVAKERLLALGNVVLPAMGTVIGRVIREILEPGIIQP